MIQRIQSIFLFLAAASAFLLFAFPFATMAKQGKSALFSDGIYNLQDNPFLLTLFCAAGLLAFISIFMFRDRKRQLLLGRIAITLNVIGLLLGIILFMQDPVMATDETVVPTDGLGAYLPFLFLVFVFLANYFINKDEKLVKSMDRLR